jgi:NADH-ubiquinone oxidoreductase chain 5
MYLTLIILPLIGSLISGFFGRKVGTKGAQYITSISIFIITILSVIIFMEVGFNSIPVNIITFR